jgi:hypothetical protein
MGSALKNGHDVVAADAKSHVNGRRTVKSAIARAGVSVLIRDAALAQSIAVAERRRWAVASRGEDSTCH